MSADVTCRPNTGLPFDHFWGPTIDGVRTCPCGQTEETNERGGRLTHGPTPWTVKPDRPEPHPDRALADLAKKKAMDIANAILDAPDDPRPQQ